MILRMQFFPAPAIGECEANKPYMKTKCAPSCQTCDMIDINLRCPPLGDDVRPGLLPGELNAMFERIVATAPGNQTDEGFAIEDGMSNYTVHVHSRPEPLGEGEEAIGRKRDLEQPPWVRSRPTSSDFSAPSSGCVSRSFRRRLQVITFDNFLSEEECKHLIDLGYKSKYERSEDVGKILPDGSYDSVQSHGRTSEK